MFQAIRVRSPIVLAVAAGFVLLSCGDASSPPVPSEATLQAGDGQEAPVATTLPAPLTVRVTDAQGQAVAGALVSWSTDASAGSLTPASGETDDSGRASANWTLGTVAGPATARATVAGLTPVTFRATVRSGAAAELRAVAGQGQRAEVGEPLPDPLQVRVEDEWGNPVAGAGVEWVVVADAGAVSAPLSSTDAGGIASVRWTMGRSTGTVESTARLAAASGGSTLEVQLSATADPSTLNLALANAYVVQSVQRWEGDVPLVAGREGLLRVFVEESRTTEQRPDVRVRLRDAAGTVVADETLAPAPGFAPGPGLSEALWADSYNYKVPGDLIGPGLRLQVEVDPGDEVVETNEDDNTFPRNGADEPLSVEEAPPVRVTFVPIHVNGATGTIDNTELMLWDVARLFPVNETDGDVRAEALDLSQYDLRESSDFPLIVASVSAARVADGSDRYYYGLLPRLADAAWGGWAVVGGPTAVGVEGEALLVAHELGHNWGRSHPPCGTAGGVDPNFPNAEGVVGVFGYDAQNSRIQEADRTDIMSYSYCGDRHWISDYTYEGVLAYRTAEAAAAEAAAGAPQRAESSLIVWGRVTGDSLVLEPAFRAAVRPSLPRQGGPYRLEGFDDSGARAFDLSFRPSLIAHAADGTAVFAFAIPVAAERRLSTIRLSDQARMTEARAPLASSPAVVDVERVDRDRVRLRWDATRHPMVVVRHPDSGTVVSFARGGDVTLRSPEGRALELVPSTGVDGRDAGVVRR